MPHTSDDTVLAQAIYNIIVANQATLLLDDVLYGNHVVIPHASAAVVVAAGKSRSLVGVQGPGGRTDNTLSVEIHLHWSKVGDETTERKNADDRATALETLIHQDTTVGGIIIHGFVNQVNRGETEFVNGGMFRSVRMTFVGTTRTNLPS